MAARFPSAQLAATVPAPVSLPTPPQPPAAAKPHLALITSPSRTSPLLARIQVHNTVVHRVRQYLQEAGYVEIPVPELTAATGSCEVVDSMFSLDYFGALAFPRQTGQLYLEELVASGLEAVYCEGESLRKEWKVDARHLTEFKLIEIEKRDMNLMELCDLQEELLKDVVRHLPAEQIGGANARRLEPILAVEHPRLTYREAIRLLSRRGFTLAFGGDLDRAAEAALCRHCGDLPVHVTHYPESLKFFNMKLDRHDADVVECVDYILPYAGETFGGSVREPDLRILRHRLETGSMYTHLMNRAREFARLRSLTGIDSDGGATAAELEAHYVQGIRDSFERYLALFANRTVERAGFGLGVARLLQYVMGLESIKEAVVFPMDRTCFGGRGTAAVTGA
jgi:asparaginyl-tRNA synthetase